VTQLYSATYRDRYVSIRWRQFHLVGQCSTPFIVLFVTAESGQINDDDDDDDDDDAMTVSALTERCWISP